MNVIINQEFDKNIQIVQADLVKTVKLFNEI